MTTHHDLLEAALARITTGYVFPEKTAAIDAAIRRRLDEGAYEDLDVRELCDRVTEDLQSVCPDKHLRLLWVEEPQSMDEEPEDVARARFARYAKRNNYGVRRVEQLDDNIGYLDLRMIAPADVGGPAIAAAMQLLAPTAALVIDLRQCRGGAPEGVQLWCSYFFPDDRVHLNDIYERATDSTRQYWTLGHLAAPRYLDRPVTVLTSDTTFSGGEELAYNLKALGRATLIGETTRGGAHPTDRIPVAPHVTVTVPAARSINPVTGANWEGVGVEPDLAVPAGDALKAGLEHLRTRLG
ncbi:S41 family peptidase [Streptomyces mobaraensis NBRC 13819 = DSM 40847]|uniref:Peptidase S41 n=1 Tax=Streptomyces mobaraensis (strain ATCC 29032 / DSM 40847 / JCM 4168 / NBRC 13819 / NCIMB 11159 / IPCR 16-22) TaxID=1223523 RepID=M2ZZ16_STRM1|nr:S41 family peptidase [Streptomyces mobaraensis]EME98018.1 peptidase S41 [Streptomyces mobaraensis NBRC 13819 = DSM 40847]QTT73114.1 S41 family peptidase [Streptomyces mobaraensis NBRC 13819 = DSM 40847]